MPSWWTALFFCFSLVISAALNSDSRCSEGQRCDLEEDLEVALLQTSVKNAHLKLNTQGANSKSNSEQNSSAIIDVIACYKLKTCDTCVSQISAMMKKRCQWCASSKTCRSPADITQWHLSECSSEPSACPAHSPVKLTQPVADQEQWLLTHEEIVSSMGGFDRAKPDVPCENKTGGSCRWLGCDSWRNAKCVDGECVCDSGKCAVNGGCFTVGAMPSIQTFSTGNRVKLLQTGSDVFAQAKADADAAHDHDFFFDSSWGFGPETLPLDSRFPNETMADVFSSAVGRGVRTRFLIFRNLADLREVGFGNRPDRDFQSTLAKAADSTSSENGKRSKVLVDGRSAGVLGSIHQKFWVTQHGQSMVAALGGVDFMHGRWDTVNHNFDNPDCKMFEGCGWYDRHVHIEGPAAADVGNTFVQRWNSRVKMDAEASWVRQIASSVWPEYKEYQQHPDPLPEPDEVALKALPVQNGTATVQILRTYPCGYSMLDGQAVREQFAPHGEISYLAGVLKAIRMAKNYIYIEDQYMLHQEEVFTYLSQALERGLVHLVVLFAKGSSVHMFGCKSSQRLMLQPLMDAYPDRVSVFVRKDSTFVHAKMWIIDDVWAVIGSANVGYRSCTSDPEIGAAILDSETVTSADGFKVAKFAHDTRIKAWSEASHFVVLEAEMAKLSLKEGLEKMASASSMVEKLTQMPRAGDYFSETYEFTCSQTDPDGRCK
eukprot:TRINITY_DN15749_c0_g1_i1.p1 TRINITY_DN15749_c0_g1~~TRINITY_DN15749_c0_g1_i1.p1  ORF type:complete len:714 (+),score=99.49 TRINITY_DN15749_c0_g1_i1:88-2229(+)